MPSCRFISASWKWGSATRMSPPWSMSSARYRPRTNDRPEQDGKNIEGDLIMIRVSKIAHASYETPDLDQQTEYYTDILGLTLVSKDKDAVYLASTVDHHSIVLREGAQAQCVRVGFQIGQDVDLGEFERQVASHGIRTERKRDPEP